MEAKVIGCDGEERSLRLPLSFSLQAGRTAGPWPDSRRREDIPRCSEGVANPGSTWESIFGGALAIRCRAARRRGLGPHAASDRRGSLEVAIGGAVPNLVRPRSCNVT